MTEKLHLLTVMVTLSIDGNRLRSRVRSRGRTGAAHLVDIYEEAIANAEGEIVRAVDAMAGNETSDAVAAAINNDFILTPKVH